MFIRFGIFASFLFCSLFLTYAFSQELTSMGWQQPVSSSEAWKLLPEPTSGSKTELPAWVRMVAMKMPRTAAAYIELDAAQRLDGPVDHKLRAAMHYTSATLNGCSYNQAVAIADLKRVGESPDRIAALKDGSLQGWSEAEKAALAFATAMTTHSDQYPDSEFAKLVEMFSPRQAASMVVHMAYSNLHDRFIKALGVVPNGNDENLSPLAVKFDHTAVLTSADDASPKPAAPLIKSTFQTTGTEVEEFGKTWLSYDELQKRLEEQRQRKPRLVAPDWSEVAPKLPKGLMDRPSNITWYQLSLGYAPELKVPFEIYMRESGGEVGRNWDRVFGYCVFWMVTNAMHCPYCMGHVEMVWEVTGLGRDEIAARSAALARGDMSGFSKAERDALQFARKITLTPAEITREDCDRLRVGFGEERAFYLVLNSSRYNYMTRISNGFQLNLEKENVFWDYFNVEPRK